MYLQCVLISRDKTIVDEQIQQIMSKQNLKHASDAYKTKQYRYNLRVNPKYVDPQLTKQSINNNQKLKSTLAKYKVQFVLVSPLKADLQTCYELFGDQQVSVFIQPSLAPRINAVSNIGDSNLPILQKFKEKPLTAKLEENPNWFLNFGKSSNKQAQSQLNHCISEIEKNENYETMSNYYQRLSEVRKDLINHVGKTHSKLAIIAHREVLEFLTSTGNYEDLQLINSVSFNFGEIKSEFIWIEGVEGELENSGIPFCS